jgi:NADH:ubiquinone reductase (H+-translocating)
MSKRIVIAGTGFAGTWSAISAARAASLAGMEDEVEITIVSPTPHLHIRPRLYESILEGMAPDLLPLFEAIGVRHLAGTVERVHAERHEVEVERTDGQRVTLPYDRFILAAGSQLFMPDVPGLKDHGFSFNVDQLAGAEALDAHLKALAGRPETAARNTVVVAGAGFTGLETATEMPERLRAILGQDTAIRVVLLEQAPVVGPDLGPVPRPVIERGLGPAGQAHARGG